MGGVTNESFGACYGYCIQLSDRNLQTLFANEEKLLKMKKFGLFSRDIFSPSDAQIISTVFVRLDKDRLEMLLRSTPNRHIGMFDALCAMRSCF